MENLKDCTFKRELSFNEWTKEFNVCGNYHEPIKYFEKNPSCGIRPIGVAKYMEETKTSRIFRILFSKLK